MTTSVASSGSTVTIDRAYYDTIMRKAQFNVQGFDRHGNPSITISQDEYESLKHIATQYGNLKRNLMKGGVNENTLEILSHEDYSVAQDGTIAPPTGPRAQTTQDTDTSLSASAPQPQAGPVNHSRTFAHEHKHVEDHNGRKYNGVQFQPQVHQWADGDVDVDEDEVVSCDDESPIDGPISPSYVKPQFQRQQQFDRQCTRTVQLFNLAEGTTHADITSAVRGGILLDVFLRDKERSAAVSFLHAADARGFYDYVRRHDLYIKNKRVDIKWSDRQFILPGHVAGKVATGASRNLVIRKYDNRHSEAAIRDDLEHIHNLVVVKVEYHGGNCYVSLNSIHNAIYARMCMMSRSTYKGTKIEWDVDECAQPYELRQPPSAKVRKEKTPPKGKGPSVANRFGLLNIDGDDDDEIATTFQSKKSVGITA